MLSKILKATSRADFMYYVNPKVDSLKFLDTDDSAEPSQKMEPKTAYNFPELHVLNGLSEQFLTSAKKLSPVLSPMW